MVRLERLEKKRKRDTIFLAYLKKAGKLTFEGTELDQLSFCMSLT